MANSIKLELVENSKQKNQTSNSSTMTFAIILIIGFIILVAISISSTPQSSKKDVSDSYTDYIKKNTERLQVENKAWAEEHNRIFAFRNLAISEDAAGNNQEAIEMYLQSIKDCEKSKFNNREQSIAYAVERVIILHGKEKDYKSQYKYLKHVIAKYPKYRNYPKWQERLLKVELKLKKS